MGAGGRLLAGTPFARNVLSLVVAAGRYNSPVPVAAEWGLVGLPPPLAQKPTPFFPNDRKNGGANDAALPPAIGQKAARRGGEAALVPPYNSGQGAEIGRHQKPLHYLKNCIKHVACRYPKVGVGDVHHYQKGGKLGKVMLDEQIAARTPQELSDAAGRGDGGQSGLGTRYLTGRLRATWPGQAKGYTLPFAWSTARLLGDAHQSPHLCFLLVILGLGARLGSR